MEHLLNELTFKIVETLNLVDVVPDDIDPNDHLIGGKLGLDSIDLLELVMMIEKDYAVKINSKELGAKVFSNIKSLAKYIYENSSKVS